MTIINICGFVAVMLSVRKVYWKFYQIIVNINKTNTNINLSTYQKYLHGRTLDWNNINCPDQTGLSGSLDSSLTNYKVTF